MDNRQDCSCWRCWAQNSFTVIVLLFLVLTGLAVTIVIMHEKSIPDEYAKWAQQFTEGLLGALMLAMNRPQEKPHPLAPGTQEVTLRNEPPVPKMEVTPIVDEPNKP